MPPIERVAPPMLIRAAASFGKRIGGHDRPRRRRPLIGAERRECRGQPAADLVDRQATPMTPVEATSTCSDRAADQARRFRRHVARNAQAGVAGAGIGAAAVDDDRARGAAGAREMLARDDDRRGLRLLVVKTAAACAGASETSSVRSGLPLALMPALTPAARKPSGVVTPPGMSESPAAIYESGAAAPGR